MDKDDDPSARIDSHLKRAFEQLETDPIPDKLMALLEQLRGQDQGPDQTDDTDEDQTAEKAQHR